ncbi:hypothetical protein F6455_17370 [Proteobacteria bacterium 005FR1]|nr:hypothetical protein [Proteobacteria bacterium 005FR1]
MREDPVHHRHRLLAIAVIVSVLLHGTLGFVFRADWPDVSGETATSHVLHLGLNQRALAQQTDSSEEKAPEALATSTEELSREEPLAAPTGEAPPKPTREPSPVLPPVPEPIPDTRLATIPDHSEVIVSAGPATFKVPAPPAPPKNIPIERPLQEHEAQEIDRRMQEVAQKLPELLKSGEQFEWHKGQTHYRIAAELRAGESTELDKALVTVSAATDGERRETQLEFKRLAFSHFAQLINRWDPDVAISRDRVDGRFHSNSAVNMDAARDATPVFTGKVTVAGRVDLGRGLRKNDVFPGGLEIRAAPIHMPRDVSPIHSDMQLTPEQLRYFDADVRLTFFENGDYSWRHIDGAHEERGERRGRVPEEGLFLLGRDRARLEVEGTVRGKVVIYSEGRITIAGDLRYARNPIDVPHSPDFLGLISEGYVEVGPPDLVGPGDLVVQAAIYAGRRFSVRSFRNRNRGTLHVYGSITAGSVSATEPRYATRLVFDKRFENQRPPNFPLTDHYELARWDRQWRVVSEDR